MKKKLLAQKKVRLAKDVIALLKAGTIKAESGIYFSARLKKKVKKSNLDELGKLIKTSIDGPCRVCAQGALIVAKALRFDKAKVSNTSDDYSEGVCFVANRYVGDGGNKFRSYLEEFFKNDAKLIEDAFEGWMSNYHQNFPDDAERLIVLMKNIIRNKGKFKPNDPKDWAK